MIMTTVCQTPPAHLDLVGVAHGAVPAAGAAAARQRRHLVIPRLALPAAGPGCITHTNTSLHQLVAVR
jgi:hypothetical protein